MEKVSREVYGDDGYIFEQGENPLRDSYIITVSDLSKISAIVEKAKAGGVKLDPLSRYYIKNTEKHEQNGQENPYENTYVMNYSSVNMENIKKVVQVLSQLG